MAAPLRVVPLFETSRESLVQVELLRRVRQSPDPQAHVALMVTVNGIAAGLRNTG